MADAGWRPILEGADADAAWEAIRAIAKDVAADRGRPSAVADRALFWAYLTGAIDEDWTNACYDGATEQLCDSIGEGYARTALFGGLAGAGFTLAHISEVGAADEILALIDTALVQFVDVDSWPLEYDLISGLVGLGVYFLERIATSPAATARHGLARVVDHLVAGSQPHDGEVAWFTRPELLPEHQRRDNPTGYFNCGLAHGNPGVIALLARIAEAGLDPRAREHGASALRWLERQTFEHPRNCLPSWFGAYAEPEPSRTAWCYGDGGAVLAALGASRRLGTSIDGWVARAAAAASRPPELCGVRDPGICHGSTGLAHIFNRIYQLTGDERLRDGALRWLRKSLASRGSEGVGGYRAWTSHTPDAVLAWTEETSLIEGAAGVALGLLAAVHPVEPAWDRMFQCDLPT